MFQIMVVDDDKNTRMLLKAVLEAENYSVLAAENGEDSHLSNRLGANLGVSLVLIWCNIL